MNFILKYFFVAIIGALGIFPVLSQPGKAMHTRYVEHFFAIDKDNINKVQGGILLHINELHQSGYLSAKIDSLTENENYFIAYIDKGPQYYYKLENVNISPIILNRLNLDSYFDNDPFPYSFLDIINQRLLRYYENMGYPFARIFPSQIEIHDSIISARLEVDLMDFFSFDTIAIEGSATISRIFLENHLSIKPGDPYREKHVQMLENKLRELDFAELDGAIRLSFMHQKATLTLPLNKKQSNQFDGFAGIVNQDDPEKPILLTGKLDLYLVNALQHGEMIDLSWQGLGHGTQILQVRSAYPYPAGIPLRLQGAFALHKQDSTWIQSSLKPAVSIQSSPWLRTGIFADFQKNNLLSTRQYQEQDVVPKNLDFTLRQYGLDFNFKSSGYNYGLLYPGHSALISVSAGRRTILRNARLPEIFYTDLPMQEVQYNLAFSATRRWRITNNTTINLESSNAFQFGKNLFENQLFRLGGFRSLRGYDEASLLASSFAFAMAEFRIFASERTFFGTFINGGWYERKLLNEYYNSFPVGAGGGLNLETQAGIFAIYVALGKQKNLPIELRNTKIHVGYTSVF